MVGSTGMKPPRTAPAAAARRPERERVHINAIDPDPHQRRGFLVLECRAHGFAYARTADEQVAGDDQRRGHCHRKEVKRRRVDTEKAQRLGGERRGDRLRLRAPEQQRHVLEEDRQPNGDERGGHHRCVAQPPEDGVLQHDGQRDDQGHRGRQGEEIVEADEADQIEREKATQHVELAVGEVRDVHHAENHREPDRDQRIGAADQHPVQQMLAEDGHGTGHPVTASPGALHGLGTPFFTQVQGLPQSWFFSRACCRRWLNRSSGGTDFSGQRPRA
jgi:hypothetical protein